MQPLVSKRAHARRHHRRRSSHREGSPRLGHRTPVIVLTALGTVPAKLAGFQARADDYLAKAMFSGAAEDRSIRLDDPTICRSIVERHGVRIGVRSDVGKGTCFTVTLPAPPYSAQPAANAVALPSAPPV
jgi:hypothetical protein